MPRRIYGDYLQALFLWYTHVLADGKKVRIEQHDVEALDVVPREDVRPSWPAEA